MNATTRHAAHDASENDHRLPRDGVTEPTRGTTDRSVSRSLPRLLFPEPVRVLPHARAWNIAFRTAHLAFTGILLGGHVFDIAEDRLRAILYCCIVTGIALIAIEAYPSCRWFYQGRGIAVLLKLAMICTIPWFWGFRVPILLAVLVIASVGSHMPSRFRYYSFLHGRVLE